MLRSVQSRDSAPENTTRSHASVRHFEIHARGGRRGNGPSTNTTRLSIARLGGARGRDDVDLASDRIRHEPEFDGLEIDHQGVRQRVVSPMRAAVERARILGRRRERGIVHHDIAADRLETPGAQGVHEAPPSIQRHVGVAAALQNQISAEHAAAQLAADQRLGVPGVRRTREDPGRRTSSPSLMVEAGLRGVSPLWLASTRPDSASTTAKLTALAGSRSAAMVRATGAGTEAAASAASAAAGASRRKRKRRERGCGAGAREQSAVRAHACSSQHHAAPRAGAPAQIQHQAEAANVDERREPAADRRRNRIAAANRPIPRPA